MFRIIHIILNGLVLFSVLFVSQYVTAQTPGFLDTTFNTIDNGFGFGNSSNEGIYTTAIQSDGKIILGGTFYKYGGNDHRGIVRLFPDGTIDSTFLGTGTNAGSYITSVVIQNDGKILVGGSFTSYNGITAKNLIRLNTNGTIDPTFTIGTGPNFVVNAIAVQANGKIIIGGSFTSINGVVRTRIARLHSNGSVDLSFNSGAGPNNTVYSVVLDTNGRVLLGGDFTFVDTNAVGRIARLQPNGTFDTAFSAGGGASGSVYEIALQANGKILLGGYFFLFNGIISPQVVRLNTNGSRDLSFALPIGSFFGSFDKLLVLPNQKIIGCGNFYHTGMAGIIRFNSNGTIDTTFTIGAGINGSYVKDVAIQTDGKLVFAGDFYRFNQVVIKNTARIDSTGDLDLTYNMGTGANDVVKCIAIQADERILIGGNFLKFNGVMLSRIARLNPNGTIDSSFNIQGGFNGVVRSLAIQNNGKIIAVGDFSEYNSNQKDRIARLNSDGTIDNAFGFTLSSAGIFNHVLVQPDQNILVCGGFYPSASSSIGGIFRLNPNGTLDTTFQLASQLKTSISKMAIQPNGKIIIIGAFPSRIARIHPNGQLDTSFALPTSFNYWISAVDIDQQGSVVIGGIFTSINGYTTNNIARFDSIGNIDATFSTGIGTPDEVLDIKVDDNGAVLIAGKFLSFDGTISGRLARILEDGSLDTTFKVDVGANDQIEVISTNPDGDIMIGGKFSAYKGKGKNRIARIKGGCTPRYKVENFNSCSSFTWRGGATYSSDTSGVLYIQPYAAGCDSVFSLTLTILPYNVTIIKQGDTLFANAGATAAYYQWLDCNDNYKPILGANHQFFIPSINGSYAVAATDSTCIDTSSCFSITDIGITKFSTPQASIYPNPSTGLLTLNCTDCLKVEILNLTGSILRTYTVSNQYLEMSLEDLPSGIYFVRTFNSNNQSSHRVVKY